VVLQQHRERVVEVADPSGPPVVVVPRATRWTPSEPLARHLAKTAWPFPAAAVSGRPCGHC
jgi:hypothetical protein